jgi:hypothetical protein
MNSIDPVFLMIAIGFVFLSLTVVAAVVYDRARAKRERAADAQRKRDLFNRWPDRQ